MKEQFGKWKVEQVLKHNRCFLATSPDGEKGVVKIGGNVKREVQNLNKLSHPNIVKMLDDDLDAEIPFLVTQYHSAGALNEGLLYQFSIDERLKMCEIAYEVVTECHKNGIMRGCFNLANIVLSEDHRLVFIDLEYSEVYAERDIVLEMNNLAELMWKLAGPQWMLKQMFIKTT